MDLRKKQDELGRERYNVLCDIVGRNENRSEWLDELELAVLRHDDYTKLEEIAKHCEKMRTEVKKLRERKKKIENMLREISDGLMERK